MGSKLSDIDSNCHFSAIFIGLERVTGYKREFSLQDTT